MVISNNVSYSFSQSEDEVEKTLDAESAVSILKGEKKNLRRKEKRARIEQIRVTLGLSDSQRTPMVLYFHPKVIKFLLGLTLNLWCLILALYP